MLSLATLRMPVRSRKQDVVLQTAGEEVAHEVDDCIVKIRCVALLNGRIIFINNDNRLVAVVLKLRTGKGS